MYVTFYEFNKKINSTARPNTSTPQLKYEKIHFKDNTSIVNPVIVLNIPMINISNYNYCYIDQTNRYYFINDIVYDNALVNIVCSIDALASYKDEIIASSQYIIRSERLYDLDVVDTQYPMLSTPSESNQVIDMGVVYANSHCFRVDIGTSHYIMDSQGYTGFLSKLYAIDVPSSAAKELLNPFQYIGSVKLIPMGIANIPSRDFVLHSVNSIRYGWWDFSVDVGNVYIINEGFTAIVETPFSVIRKSGNFTVANHPQYNRGHYLNTSPYRNISIYSPLFGTASINDNDIVDVTSFHWDIDYDLVSCEFRFRITAHDKTMFLTSGAIGIDLPLSEQHTNIISGATDLISSAVSGMAGIAMSSATGTPVQALTSAFSTSMNVANALREMVIPQVQTRFANTSYLNVADIVYINVEYYLIADEDISRYGRPYMREHSLATNGYILCHHVTLPFKALESEKEIIKTFLESGCYLE